MSKKITLEIEIDELGNRWAIRSSGFRAAGVAEGTIDKATGDISVSWSNLTDHLTKELIEAHWQGEFD